MATGVSDFTSDDIIHNKCFLCEKDNRRREGDRYCIQCKNYLCSSCAEIHNDSPFTNGHQIMDKTDFRTLGEDGALPSYPIQRCSVHSNKVVDMFCRDHDEVTCTSCVALNHRSCKNILSIPDKVDSLYQTAALIEIKEKIADYKEKIEEIRHNQESIVMEVKNFLDKAIKSVKAFRKELQCILDDMERESIQELKNQFHHIETSLSKDINEAKSLVDALKEAASQVKQSEGNKAQEFVTIKCSEKLTSECELFQQQKETIREESICFTPDPSIRKTFKQFKTLGKVNVDKKNVTAQEKKEATPKDGLYKVKRQREINVNLQSEPATCVIWGSCFTKDSDLLLADHVNNKLKLLDMKTEKLKEHVDLQNSPRGVCMVSDKEAAVTMDNNTVQFVSLSGKMTASRTLTMNHTCYGLAHKDNKLFISDLGKTLCIYEMSGKELKRISTDASGNNIFSSIQHVTVTRDRLFVTDWNKGLVVLDLQGNYLCTVDNLEVSYCRGVCTDGRNVFVSGCFSGKIVQIGDNLQRCGEVGKVTNPLSMCYNNITKMLIATSHSNNISALELE